jgi:hypothetical protein
MPLWISQAVRGHRLVLSLIIGLLVLTSVAGRAQSAESDDLRIVADGAPQATIIVAETAGPWERRAAEDLQKYIARMSGASVPVVSTPPSGTTPVIFVGRAALEAEPSLGSRLEQVAKKDPLIRADAIVAQRSGNRIYLAGSNDDSHYFAASWLLQHWGCRWYLPTDFGEVIPEHRDLTVGNLDHAYAPPFEIRHYWLSWNGDQTGATEFRRRNFMTETSMVGMGHALGQYTKTFPRTGDSPDSLPFTDPALAEHVAQQIESHYAAGKDISLAIEDTTQVPHRADIPFIVEYDKYMLFPSLTDAMMTFYNNVGHILRTKHPTSKAKIGGMAYSNVTLPPQIVTEVEPNVVMWIAPIDIDPNHTMTDPRSPPRQEYKAMMERWATLMKGRLAIYDYDQGMLVWRDLPNPSHHVFAEDVKHYRAAGILGIGTESRGATATTFLNLFFRGQLMWNPDQDVDHLLAEFYPSFYGPAAGPMAAYWGAIFDAWKNTIVTEHEYFAAPAIYTPELVAELRGHLASAEASVAPLRNRGNLSRNEQLLLERMRFTRLSFDVIANYVAMVTHGARDGNYSAAAAAGDHALAAREELTAMNPTFTTYKTIGEAGPAWFPGEVQQMRDLRALTDGTRGELVAPLPLDWSFRVSAPLPKNWVHRGSEGDRPADGTIALEDPTATSGWRNVRTDLYLQAQGILAEDGQSPVGTYWYQTPVELTEEQARGRLNLMFPGLFNEAWLYINGELIARRDYDVPWWEQDYHFDWDVDISGKLKPGRNVVSLRGFNPHHAGGMFRRPFVYRPRG